MFLEKGKWYTCKLDDGSTLIKLHMDDATVWADNWTEIEPPEIKPAKKQKQVKDVELKAGMKIRSPESALVCNILADPVLGSNGRGFHELFIWLAQEDSPPMTYKHYQIKHWIVVEE